MNLARRGGGKHTLLHAASTEDISPTSEEQPPSVGRHVAAYPCQCLHHFRAGSCHAKEEEEEELEVKMNSGLHSNCWEEQLGQSVEKLVQASPAARYLATLGKREVM